VAEVRTDSAITPQRFADLCKFFDYFDADVIAHNRREEQELFPILRQRMLERGEHSTAPNPITPVSVLEGEHTQTAQVSTVARSFCALVRHLDDPASRQIVLSVALERCDALIEMMRLHVFREDRIVFVLAQEFLSADELSALSA
jgi:iron-sulfur cluster repair protein YtfE (RIC family)